MNANDYCSAPPPLFLLRHAPSHPPPFCSASDRDALQEGKATSTGQHRDQYW